MFKKALCIILSCAMLSLTGCRFVDKLIRSDVCDMFEDAFRNKNVEYLNEIVARYPDFDINKHERGSSLWTSLYNNGGRGFDLQNMTFSRALLEAGADPNSYQAGAGHVLITACDNDFWYAPELLIEYGTDVNIVSSTSGRSALCLVMNHSSGSEEVTSSRTAKLLVENGAEVTPDLFTIDRKKHEDLQYSLYKRSPVVANYLMKILHEKGENTNMPPAVEYAISGDLDKTIGYVEKGAELNDAEKTFICEYAHYYGTPDDINRLYELFGIEEPIYIMPSRVVECGNLEVVKYLNEKYELYYVKNNGAFLATAIAYGYEDIFDYMINNTDVKAHGYSLLKSALYYDDLELFKKVYNCIEENREITENDFRNFHGQLNGKYEYIDFLMDEKKHSMGMLTLEDVDYETAKYMFDKGRPLNITDLDHAMIHADPEYMKLVLDHGADVNQREYSLEQTYFEEMFYDEGMDYSSFIEKHHTNAYDEELPVSFPRLLRYCSGDCVKVMIEHGAKMDDDIFEGSYEYSCGVVKALIDGGANTKVKFENPITRKSIIKKGKYSLKEYFEIYGREDLVELVK